MQTPVFKEPGSSGHGVVPKDHGLLAELFLPDRRKINTTTKRAMNFVMVLKKGCQSVATLAHTITDRLVYLLIMRKKDDCNPCHELGFVCGWKAGLDIWVKYVGYLVKSQAF